MLLNHFQLREQPFGVTPDPRFLYATGTHREVLASLLYGIDSGVGFIALIANPGMGKTTLLFETLHRIGPATRTVFLVQSIPSPIALLQLILADLGDPSPQASLIDMQYRLNSILVEMQASQKRLIVVIDEAQNLSEEVLETVRMLSNFETAQQKLIQIVLSGQPGLGETLRLPRLLQLRQRISIFARLQPLSADETARYVDHRLKTAGYALARPLFTRAALALIAKSSEGIPRNINKIAFNALTIACALQKDSIDYDVVHEALTDCGFEEWAKPARNQVSRMTGRLDKRGSPSILRQATNVRIWGGRKLALTTLASSLVVVLFSWLAVLDYRAIIAEEEPSSVLSSSSATKSELQSQPHTASKTSSKLISTTSTPGKPPQAFGCSITDKSNRCEHGEEGDLKQ